MSYHPPLLPCSQLILAAWPADAQRAGFGSESNAVFCKTLLLCFAIRKKVIPTIGQIRRISDDNRGHKSCEKELVSDLTLKAVLSDHMKGSLMQKQIELPFRGDRKLCRSVRRSRRSQWARLWFARMHEIVEEAEDRAGEHKQTKLGNSPDNSVKED
jgi:hypothetical protein